MMIPPPKEIFDPFIPSWSIILAKISAAFIALYGTYLILSILIRDDKKK